MLQQFNFVSYRWTRVRWGYFGLLNINKQNAFLYFYINFVTETISYLSTTENIEAYETLNCYVLNY
jgi:hypothetical protein